MYEGRSVPCIRYRSGLAQILHSSGHPLAGTHHSSATSPRKPLTTLPLFQDRDNVIAKGIVSVGALKAANPEYASLTAQRLRGLLDHRTATSDKRRTANTWLPLAQATTVE